jgi:hypothetical protein
MTNRTRTRAEAVARKALTAPITKTIVCAQRLHGVTQANSQKRHKNGTMLVNTEYIDTATLLLIVWP